MQSHLLFADRVKAQNMYYGQFLILAIFSPIPWKCECGYLIYKNTHIGVAYAEGKHHIMYAAHNH